MSLPLMSGLRPCALCGKQITPERSRLFWSTDPENPGTYRVCDERGARACKARQRQQGKEPMYP